MHTDQQVKKRLRDEFNDIEVKNMWNITFRVSICLDTYSVG